MKDFEYQVIDAFEGNNVIKGHLQRLPAYLTLSTLEIEASYIIDFISPEGKTVTNLTGNTRLGANYHWRIPIIEPGEWKIHLQLKEKETMKLLKDNISLKVQTKLFEFSTVDEDYDNEYIAELATTLPSKGEIQDVDIYSRYIELNAHWLLFDTDLKLRRYIYQDTESKLKQGRFIPIILVHGFNSDYTTWNWLVRYLWADGFRNIFAVDLFDDRLGIEKNAEKLLEAIDEILRVSNHKSLYFIGHSLGGLVGRYIVKQFDPKKIKLLTTIGSPHICGLSKIWGKIVILLKNAQLTERDVILNPSSTIIKTQKIMTEEDFYQQTMINICGTKILGGDGGFKFKDNLVPDMVNLGINYIHLSLHKNDDTYSILHNVIYANSIIYKIRLLYIQPVKENVKNEKICLYTRPKGKNDYQRYPISGFLEISTKKPFMPEVPIIIFTNLRNNKEKELVEIQIKNEKNKLIAKKEFIFALGYKKPIGDHFALETKTGFSFQFVIYSYRLHYELNEVE